MTSCERYKQYILDCMDDELDILHRKDLESHLKVCEPCSLLANRCRSLKKRLKDLPQVKASDEFPILLRGRIRRELAKKRTYRPNFFFFPNRWIPAVGMAVVLLVAGVWMVTGNMRAGKKPL